MPKISFTPEALSDLQQIKSYIADELCNEKAALNTVNKIMKRIKTLEAFPLSGASLAAIVGFTTEYRYLVCENYTVFYRVQNEAVTVVRVLYSRRDFMRILFDESKNND